MNKRSTSDEWLIYTGKNLNAESRSTDILAVAVSSIVVVALLVISVFIFIIAGLIYFSRKFKQSSKETPSQPDPLYEDVLPSAVEHQEQDLELKENVAYGPLRSPR